jgi:glucose/arabinose dehydrogenase
MTSKALSLLTAWVLSVSVASGAEWPEIDLEERWAGFSRPVQLIHAGDGSGRLFVVEQGGRIRLIDGDGVVAAPFLDISDRVSCCGERGLLGLAFPPGFSSKRHFYVNYTDASGDTVVARYRLTGDPSVADEGSEEVVFMIDQPFSNHNGGQLAFGPDGYLYIGTGDGGSGGDPQNNAQNRLSLLGKILRIDVESGADPYAIPDSNPFAHVDDAQPEIWALGLRNPWRFSFDTSTGDLFVADVGQSNFEEVHVQPASSTGGENYGWRILEGSHCFESDSCDTAGLELPVFEYDHSLGCSVTGGFVSRSGRWPRLEGVYLLGDYCSGRVWGLRRSGDGWEGRQLAESGFSISGFGIDEQGAVYVLDYGSGTVAAVTDSVEAPAYRALVPAVAHLSGSGGTPWRADLAVVNAGGSTVTVDLTYRGDGFEIERTESIEPGAAVEWRDVLASLFGLASSVETSGVVEVESTARVAVAARSYAVTDQGTLGQFLPGLTEDHGLRPGGVGVLPLLSRTGARYSNVGAVNLGDAACEVTVRLKAADGSALGGPLLFELAPGEWRQAFDVFAGLGTHQAASAVVEVLTPECKAWAYASLIDRESRDPTTIPVQF